MKLSTASVALKTSPGLNAKIGGKGKRGKERNWEAVEYLTLRRRRPTRGIGHAKQISQTRAGGRKYCLPGNWPTEVGPRNLCSANESQDPGYPLASLSRPTLRLRGRIRPNTAPSRSKRCGRVILRCLHSSAQASHNSCTNRDQAYRWLDVQRFRHRQAPLRNRACFNYPRVTNLQ